LRLKGVVHRKNFLGHKGKVVFFQLVLMGAKMWITQVKAAPGAGRIF
jgi:hypothetical protein